MTQPDGPAQPSAAAQPDDNGHILAVAAIGLALIAVETRVRQDVEDDIQAALTLIAAAGVLAASTAPATIITGIALMSLPALHRVLTGSLDNARNKVASSIETGYSAAAQVALTKVTADLAHDGYTVPATLPELDNTIDVILTDVDTMFGHAQTDLQRNIAAAYDADPDTDQRVVAIHNAVDAAGKRLNNRAAAAAGTAVQQGASDAQQAIYNQYQNNTGTPGLMKRWVVTAVDPCGMCEALNGTMVGVNAEFDHNATTDDKHWRPVWRNLLGPPRHPNCRCQLQLVKT